MKRKKTSKTDIKGFEDVRARGFETVTLWCHCTNVGEGSWRKFFKGEELSEMTQEKCERVVKLYKEADVHVDFSVPVVFIEGYRMIFDSQSMTIRMLETWTLRYIQESFYAKWD